MKNVIAILALTLVGCAPDISDDYVNTMQVDCLTIHSNIEWGPKTLKKWIDAARMKMDSAGIVPEQDFCQEFSGVPVVILSDMLFRCGDENCQGVTHPYVGTNHVFVNVRGDALVHELTHVHELLYGIFNTDIHPQWEEKGYYKADEEFAKSQTLLGSSFYQ